MYVLFLIISLHILSIFVVFAVPAKICRTLFFFFLLMLDLWTLQHNKAQNANVSPLLLQQQQQQQQQEEAKQREQNADKPCAVLVATVALSG